MTTSIPHAVPRYALAMLGISLLLATFACRKQEEEPAVLASPVKGVAASSGNLKAGMPAPELDFEQVLQAPEGTKANWETLRGKAVVLEFWATWCGPCVAAIPHLNELAEKYAGKPLQFISITNEKEDTVAKFLKRKPIKAWVGLDTKQTVSRAYGVSGIPVTVLVDAQGKLAGFTYPTQVTEKVLDDLLAGRPLAGMETPAGGKSIRPGVEPVADEAAPPPLFQVVIRPFAGEAGGSMLSGDGRLTLNGVGIASAIPYAYGVPSYRTDIACELPEAKYDVTVLLPLGNEKQLEPLLRQALEMTFGLKTRQETRTRDAYELVVAEGGPKLTATVMDAGAGSSSRGGLGVLELINATTDSLASNLANRLNRPVFDQTGQASRYDMSLSWDEEEAGGLAVEVRAQLGLELKPVQRAVEMLVVEKVAGS